MMNKKVILSVLLSAVLMGMVGCGTEVEDNVGGQQLVSDSVGEVNTEIAEQDVDTADDTDDTNDTDVEDETTTPTEDDVVDSTDTADVVATDTLIGAWYEDSDDYMESILVFAEDGYCYLFESVREYRMAMWFLEIKDNELIFNQDKSRYTFADEPINDYAKNGVSQQDVDGGVACAPYNPMQNTDVTLTEITHEGDADTLRVYEFTNGEEYIYFALTNKGVLYQYDTEYAEDYSQAYIYEDGRLVIDMVSDGQPYAQATADIEISADGSSVTMRHPTTHYYNDNDTVREEETYVMHAERSLYKLVDYLPFSH